MSRCFAFCCPGPLRRAVGAGLGLLLAVLIGPVSDSRAQPQQAPTPSVTDTTQLTFDEAVRIALDQNTDVKRAQASVREASAQVQAEWMDFAPDLSLSSSTGYDFGRGFSQVEGEVVTQSRNSFNVSARSGITLFNGFENTASLRQANNQARASELSLDRTRREVAFTVMDQFIALLESREQVRVRREQLQALRQQLEQTQEFVDSGASPVSDLYRQQADVAEAEQQLLQARREREVGKTRLIQTLQLNPQAAYDFQVPDLEGDTLGTATYNLSALIDEAFRNRLDLQVAKAERRAAEQNVRVAKSSYYPTVSIGGSYRSDWLSTRKIQNPQTGRPVRPTFFDQLNNNRGGGISLSLSIPIFDRLQRNAQVERAQVQAQNAEYNLRDQRQQVALQVRQAYLDYRNAVQQLQAARKRLKAARQARTATQERYNLGAASIVELRNANRDFVDAASQRVRARYNLLFRQKQIDYHVGRLDPRRPLRSTQTTQ
ncbi:MAG: TolC family protein [Salinibacter sp.]